MIFILSVPFVLCFGELPSVVPQPEDVRLSGNHPTALEKLFKLYAPKGT
jgi:hypothetical protein